MTRLRQFFRRDLPLVTRFRRGVRVGFAVTCLLALGTLILTELTSTSLDRDVSLQRDVGDQRAEIALLAGRLPLLANVDSAAEADALRFDIGTRIEVIERRQLRLQVGNPDLRSTLVELNGETMALDEAFTAAFLEVETTVETVSNPAMLLVLRSDAVAAANASLAALDAAYREVIEQRSDAALVSADRIKDVGRILAVASLVAGVLRLIVVGRPLVNRLADEAANQARAEEQNEADRLRGRLAARLTEGLEVADDETSVFRVVERVFDRVLDGPTELLLADSSRAHLAVAAEHPQHGAAGCSVQNPWSCPAIRRGSTQIFEDSEGIRACPYLVGRHETPCSAVCVPVSQVGESMGVIHITGELGEVHDTNSLEALSIIAGQTAVRLGAIRSFQKAEIQASTDVLTGLPNRRSVEEFAGRFMSGGQRGSVAIADLDKFKLLNDTHGHEAGDRALRMFAEVLRSTVREVDVAGRWGGEEFVVVLPGLSASEASNVLNQVRAELARACARYDGPAVTVSIGVVDTSSGRDLDGLVSLADDCLYVAKEQGRDRVIVGPVAGTVPAAPTASASNDPENDRENEVVA